MKDRRVYVFNEKTCSWENRSISKIHAGESFCFSLNDMIRRIGKVFTAASHPYQTISGDWDVNIR